MATNKRRRSTRKTNLNSKRSASAKLPAGVDNKEEKSAAQLFDTDSISDEGTEYLSEGGEGRYISPGNNRFADLSEPSTDDEVEVTKPPRNEELLEAELEQVVTSKQSELDHCQELVKKLKEEMKPLLKVLKEKIEARRQ